MPPDPARYRPVHPSLIPKLPMEYKATLYRRHGALSWVLRWKVRRQQGFANLECEWSYFITRYFAERCARRWTRKNQGKPDEPIRVFR